MSKPFGASSVTNEYQPSRLPSSLRFAADRNSGMRSLARQLHIRSALSAADSQPVPGSSTSSTAVKLSPGLPLTGLKLVPQYRSTENKDGEDGGEHDEFGMDLSDSDMPISDHNESFDASRGKTTPYIVEKKATAYLDIIFMHYK